jgi:hypothetical protein
MLTSKTVKREDSVICEEDSNEFQPGASEEGDGVGGKKKNSSVASARFRVKKKMKEQQLETNAKTITAKVHALQRKISVLEAEASYLRELVRLRAQNEAAMVQEYPRQMQDPTAGYWPQS